jgi:putative two-component system response regulator
MIEQYEVIIVEHDLELIQMIAHNLHDHTNITNFKTSTECMNHLKTGVKVDVLFLCAQNTLTMDFVEWIRNENRYLHLPILLMINQDQVRDEALYYAKGVSDILIKPLRSARLLAAFKHYAEHKRLQDFVMNQEKWLESSLSKRLYDMQLSLDLSLDIVSNLVATREELTGQKVTKLKRYYELILRKLQLHPKYNRFIDEKYIIRTVKACPLHDIGKLGIPEAILLKKDKLTVDEFTLVKTHTILGYDSIRSAIEPSLFDRLMESAMNSESLEFFREALNIAKYHHERWDGNGYPEGLKGPQIPLSARIMAIVDVFDALTNKKVYKDAWSIEKAFMYIKDNSGTQFDPDVVHAFTQEFDAIRKVFERNLKLSDSEAY